MVTGEKELGTFVSVTHRVLTLLEGHPVTESSSGGMIWLGRAGRGGHNGVRAG